MLSESTFPVSIQHMDTVANAPTAYEGLGWFYDRYWRGFCAKAMPALDRLALSHLPRRARILDLCCGTGWLSAALGRRGFRVTGLYGSEDMLRFARANASQAAFVAADARRFHFCASSTPWSARSIA